MIVAPYNSNKFCKGWLPFFLIAAFHVGLVHINCKIIVASFHTICLRFTEDFQMAMDDWRPTSYDTIMNSYEAPLQKNT